MFLPYRKYKACSLLDFSINASVPHPLCTVLAMTQRSANFIAKTSPYDHLLKQQLNTSLFLLVLFL